MLLLDAITLLSTPKQPVRSREWTEDSGDFETVSRENPGESETVSTMQGAGPTTQGQQGIVEWKHDIDVQKEQWQCTKDSEVDSGMAGWTRQSCRWKISEKG